MRRAEPSGYHASRHARRLPVAVHLRLIRHPLHLHRSPFTSDSVYIGFYEANLHHRWPRSFTEEVLAPKKETEDEYCCLPNVVAQQPCPPDGLFGASPQRTRPQQSHSVPTNLLSAPCPKTKTCPKIKRSLPPTRRTPQAMRLRKMPPLPAAKMSRFT